MGLASLLPTPVSHWIKKPPSLPNLLAQRGMVERFRRFCQPHVRSAVVVKWLRRVTETPETPGGREFTQHQVKAARIELNCGASRGGPRPPRK